MYDSKSVLRAVYFAFFILFTFWLSVCFGKVLCNHKSIITTLLIVIEQVPTCSRIIWLILCSVVCRLN